LPLLYIGSGTQSKRGVASRFSHYDKKIMLPSLVQQAIDDEKYYISHKAVILSCPIPPPALRPLVRTAIVALEALITCIFWALPNPDCHYGFDGLFAWPRSQHEYDYDGCCSHNPLLEGADLNINLSAAQLEEMAAKRKAKEQATQAAYQKVYRRDNADHLRVQHKLNARRRYASPAHKVKASATKKRNYPKRAAKLAAQKKAKTFYCEDCDVACRTAGDLAAHKKRPTHIKRVEGGGKLWGYCHDCQEDFFYPSNLKIHQQGKPHKDRAAANALAKQSQDAEAN
jgi:hypothetical protein